MRILHVDTGKEWRGGQRQAFFLHNGVQQHGHTSRLVCHPEGELFRRAENKIPLAFRSELDPVYIIKLIKIINEYKPDIVHSHDSHSLTPCIIASWFNNSFKLVHTRRVDFPLKKFFNKYKSKKVHLAAVCEAVRVAISKSGIPAESVERIYSGANKPEKINIELAEEFRRKYNPTGKKVLGTVANFSDQKDYPTLLRAFERLYEKRQDIVLLAVGDGPLFDEIKEQAKSLKSFPNIVFTGFSANVPEMLYIMDLFTITSRSEGICSCLIDTMNAGLPTVATKAGGIPEIITDGKTGLLCDVGDDKALAEGYLRLFEDEKLYKEMSANALVSAYDFSVERMVLSYLNMYDKILK